MLTIEQIPFALRESISEAVQLLRPKAVENGIELLVDIRPDVPTRIVGDPTRLRQIIVNLLGNAIKFTPAGRVTITVASESDATAAPILHISVTDTGIGVPEDKRASIFDAFTQADSSTSRRFGGTGLGLTITTQLVSLLGGRIWLESTAGEGSTFHVTLPAKCVSEPDVIAASSALEQPIAPLHGPGPPTALRVLVAEDNAINRALARGLLEKRGHIVTLAGNGVEAVEAAASATFDTILMDVQMPQMDGLEATAAIRAAARGTGRSVRIVALTAHARDEDRRQCLAAGMDDYLSKPYGAEELFRAIETGARTSPLQPAPGAGTPTDVVPM